MDELKDKTMEIIDQVNQGWVKEFKEAEKEKRGIDLSSIMAKYSENIKKLDQYFREAKQRLSKKGKGFFAK
jgi:hypothetical protein